MGQPEMPQPEEDAVRPGGGPGTGPRADTGPETGASAPGTDPGTKPGPAAGPATGTDTATSPAADTGTGAGALADPGADLTGEPFPAGDWGDPVERLDELYRWVESAALRTAGWYLADRTWKRRGARALRAGAAGGAVVGALLPLLDLAAGLHGAAEWGYPALLAAVACAAGDRWFGLTAGWMRDVATAQAVQRRLQVLQFDWASESVREVLGPAEGTSSEATERCLGMLRRFSDDMTDLVRGETAEWMIGFRTGGAVPVSVRGPGEARGGGEPTPVGRTVPAMGVRPNMPRQRPPETPSR
ncbi:MULTISPECIES: SLATT domain-containing protein [unclassified Streptomyces]|uniref:SLATT domain-containing protein n=1 Tax=unclassified Streptomyces TaxID=2593676 RepID=UPI002E1E93CB|nr:SLATT domain-containing protein [Streptomyces sp. NBC_01023]